MNELASAVKRDACPLRRSFVEREEGDQQLTPLAKLLRTQDEVGGKGGGLRISLLMSIIWICARAPYSTTRVAPYWAELLGREDPREEGARTIRDCLHELSDRGFIALRPEGSRIEIVLKNESGQEQPLGLRQYRPPYGLEPYLQVPRTFWTTGLVGRLSGAGVAMYLVSLALTRHDSTDFFIAGRFFEERFGISRSSRKRGLAELVHENVLTVESVESVDLVTFRRRRRNVYTVSDEFRQRAPWSEGQEPGDTSTAVNAIGDAVSTATPKIVANETIRDDPARSIKPRSA